MEGRRSPRRAVRAYEGMSAGHPESSCSGRSGFAALAAVAWVVGGCARANRDCRRWRRRRGSIRPFAAGSPHRSSAFNDGRSLGQRPAAIDTLLHAAGPASGSDWRRTGPRRPHADLALLRDGYGQKKSSMSATSSGRPHALLQRARLPAARCAAATTVARARLLTARADAEQRWARETAGATIASAAASACSSRPPAPRCRRPSRGSSGGRRSRCSRPHSRAAAPRRRRSRASRASGREANAHRRGSVRTAARGEEAPGARTHSEAVSSLGETRTFIAIAASRRPDRVAGRRRERDARHREHVGNVHSAQTRRGGGAAARSSTRATVVSSRRSKWSARAGRSRTDRKRRPPDLRGGRRRGRRRPSFDEQADERNVRRRSGRAS